VKTTIAAVFVVALASLARADTPESLRKTGELRWGADHTGGAPFVFEENGKLIGFEFELAEYLAKELGLRSKPVHGQWEMLPAMLNRGDIDVVLNGYEWFPDREKEWASTIPYYLYKLQLLVRKDNPSIHNWDELKPGADGRRRRVGVLKESAAERYLEERYGNDIRLEGNKEGITSAMLGVKTGQFDATVQDSPTAGYYLPKEFPELRPVGEAIAPSEYPYYVIFVSQKDPELVKALNAAILKGLRDGTLRRIYEKYGLWTADQEGLAKLAENWPPPVGAAVAAAETNLALYARSLAVAAGMTVLLSVVSMPLAMLVGMLVAIGRLYGPRWLAVVFTAYVEFLRGTPLLMQLYFIYFILPQIGVRFDPIAAGIMGLAINYSAYESENYRAGILAVPPGQTEAALALGMTTSTALRHVIVPQAFRIIVPLEINNFIALFKDSSVCSVIGVIELTGRYNQLSNNHPGLVLVLVAITAGLYMLMSYPLALVTRRLEKRLGRVAV
jgi:polar amino acid transport system substrate-binding protein